MNSTKRWKGSPPSHTASRSRKILSNFILRCYREADGVTPCHIGTQGHKIINDLRHRFFRAFSSVVRQMPGLFSQRRGTVRTLQVSVCSNVTRSAVLLVFYIILCNVILFYVLFILCIILYYSMYRLCVYVYKPLPPGVYPIAVDKYINIYIFSTVWYIIVRYKFITVSYKRAVTIFAVVETSVNFYQTAERCILEDSDDSQNFRQVSPVRYCSAEVLSAKWYWIDVFHHSR
jgi:hypothetical protein